MTRATRSTPARLAPRGTAPLQIDDAVIRALRAGLPDVATATMEAVNAEVPGYAGGLSGPMGATIEGAVQMALAGFLRLAGEARDVDPSTPMGPTLEGAYALGRGEARGGRSMDALLSAYRVGARVAWRELAGRAADAGLSASTMANFAELLFAYIDGLSAASVAGHTDELTTSGRVLERYRERLARHLLDGADAEVLATAAERAEWQPPTTLTAVLLPPAQVRGALASLAGDTLQVGDDLPGPALDQPWRASTLLLVPDAGGPARAHLLRVLAGRQVVIGPARRWTEARVSYDRAARTAALATTTPSSSATSGRAGAPAGTRVGSPSRGRAGDAPLDSEDHLAELVLGADPHALADLRARVLEPLAGLAPATRDRLTETLLSWLLHQGRREEVAAELHVHAQTVRYRMGQVRDLYGERLADPRFVRELVLALPGPVP